jgi:NAD(P)-dependent dehydrogenase (short-subunit alcohol dehydrogenase family)
VQRAVTSALAHLGGLDVVIANAGIASNGTVAERTRPSPLLG